VTTRPFDLGPWRVDPARGVLIAADGSETRLEPKLMNLLLLFAGSPGRVIAKDEIVATVWEGRAIGDDTLAAAVSRLRAALGDTKGHRFIETLPKRGYRLVIAPDGAVPVDAAAASETNALLAKGRAALLVPVPQSLAQARVYFEAAVAADPGSATAHAGLADAMLAQHLAGQGAHFAESARAAAQAATALDAGNADAWALLGAAILLADRDFARADAAVLKAIALDPDLARAHRTRAFALSSIGRFVEAEREARRAIEIEPLSFAARGDLLQILLCARRFPQAVNEARKTIQMSAQSADAWSALGWAQHLSGNDPDAVDALLEGVRLIGTAEATLVALRQEFVSGGFEAFCAAGARLLQQQRLMFAPKAMDLAMLHANGGDPDAAFAALEDAIRTGDPVTLMLPWLPLLDRLRNDPRFAGVLARARPVH
jgi:DNA-binding winged helix-turn-helix (wHTH) protein/Tfp pilus assembly protein PilF